MSPIAKFRRLLEQHGIYDQAVRLLREHKRLAEAKSGVRIIHNRVLGGWFVVRGPHDTPISGRFDSKAEAQASLERKDKPPERKDTK